MRMKNSVHPGEIVKEDILAESGVTVSRAAEILGLR
jgi:plasmid maintenance system antidote protein VapI